MRKIKTIDDITKDGKVEFGEGYEFVGTAEEADAILMRSTDLHGYELPEGIRAIARCGAGVNNIPVEEYAKKGVVVFNSPGANSNAVKELVLGMLVLSSRGVVQSMNWVRDNADDPEIQVDAEKAKKAFVGRELKGKRIGVIGLGNVGSKVANACVDLGMDVYGYDPFLSVDTALRLDRHVHVVKDINDLYKRADYVTMHIHYTEKTAHMINADAIGAMKRGVRVINLARGEIVDDEAMLAALDTGKVAAYITDFPNNRLLAAPHVIALPHLGASTPESEQNCAAMAVDELRDYLENGNIRTSVNLPEMSMERSGVQRLCILHKNVPGMLANITSLFGRDGVNVENLSNKSRGDYAYTMVDLSTKVGGDVVEDVKRMANVIRVRVLEW